MRSAWNLPELKAVVAEYPEVLETVKQLDAAYYEPSAPNFTQVRDALHDTLQDILANKVALRAGLSAVNAKGNALLANRP